MIIEDTATAWRRRWNHNGNEMEPEYTHNRVLADVWVGHPQTTEVTPLYDKPFSGESVSIPEHVSQKLVGQGMAIAAGIIMSAFGEDVYAKEIMGAAGYQSLDDLKRDGVDDYDIDLLRPLFEAKDHEAL